MKKNIIRICRLDIPVYSVNTIIIGSGAASLNCADHLFSYGQKDIAIVTSLLGGGTSNNAGSDKQTYYKISLSGDLPDSSFEMAKDLFQGGSMHGDIAMCEAQNSTQAFFNLISLGVPFPHDRFGAYTGYKTDHDPCGRATSAGPLTSHLMFKHIAKDILKRGIKILDRHEVIALLTQTKGSEKHVIGAIAIDKSDLNPPNYGFVVFNARSPIR